MEEGEVSKGKERPDLVVFLGRDGRLIKKE